MIKTIDRAFLIKHNACADGLAYWEECGLTDVAEFILKADADAHNDWAWWVIQRTFDHKSHVRLAVYAARLVLPIFTREFPNDPRPEKAILAAERFLEADLAAEQFLEADADWDADWYADWYAARSAAYAARSASDAAYAARSASDDAEAASCAANGFDAVKIRKQIINYAAELIRG